MANQLHKIGRQYLNLEFNGSEAEAMTLQGGLSGLCMTEIAPVIERVFNRCSDPEALLRIERLDIDAGSVALDHVERMLPEMIEKALEKALRETPGIMGALPDLPDGSHVRHMTKQECATEAFLFFLDNGTLPWAFLPGSQSGFESLVLESWGRPAPGGSTDAVVATIRRSLSVPVARKRLIAQFSRPFTESLLERLHPGAVALLKKALLRLQRSRTVPVTSEKVEDAIREQAFAHAASAPGFSEEAFLTEIEALALMLPQLETADKKVAPPLTGDKPDTATGDRADQDEKAIPQQEVAGKPLDDKGITLPDTASSIINNENEDTKRKDVEATQAEHDGWARPDPPSFAERDIPANAGQEEGRTSENPITKERLPSPDQEIHGEHPDEQSGIYVDNAGLVLLHPFLPQCFEALGIARHEEILLPDRALQLLHHLSTGKENAPEYELVIPKILCGLQPGTPTGKPSGLTPEDREESAALLSAVVRHWDALKNTAPEVLRRTYIKRPGKLSRRNDGNWLLQVESNSYDILLERLPWGISMIRLPWMTRMLHVEWYY
ncbi:MAG: hypothetical protein HGB00_05715 [Chlorobiaceae bacterium]|nr:hypothetical protein [Chlorobiaceae bacterium]